MKFLYSPFRLLHLKHLSYGVILVYALLWHYFTLVSAPAIFSVDNVKPIESAYISEQPPAAISPHDTLARQVSLPDDWYHSGYRNQELWYSITVSQPINTIREKTNWAIYIPSVTHNLAVYVNDIWVGQSGDFVTPLPRYHNTPQIFSFNESLLQPNSNRITIHVAAAYPSQGLLSKVYLAPVEQLVDAYSFKYFVRITLVEWMTLCMFLLALVSLIFFAYRPQDTIYGIFALELILWSLHNLNLLVHDIPVSSRTWEAFTMATFVWTVVAMVLFNHRYLGKTVKTAEYAALALAVSAVFLFALPNSGLILSLGYAVWDSAILIIGIYAISFLLYHFHKTPELDTFLMIMSGLPILSFGFHDILVVNHFLDKQDGLTIQYSCVPALLLFSWFIIRRFVNSLNTAEDLALNLENRVKQRENEIKQQFHQLRKLESEQLLSNERVRIMRDMHDGIGGQLVAIASSLNDSNSPQLAGVRDKIKLCINDLRIVIDSLDPNLNDIGVLLGTLRARLEGQLKQAGISLNWDIQTLPKWIQNTPQQNLHLLRILQEAITNAIKHSRCTHITLRAYTDTQSRVQNSQAVLNIEIIDNGIGLDAAHQPSNGQHGIKNMRYRANEIGATLALIDTGNGSCCRVAIGLCVPLSEAIATP